MKLAVRLAWIAALAVSNVVAQTPPPEPTPAPAAAAVPVAMVDEVKIVIEDKAEGDGKIELVFTPQGGSPGTISVLVAKKMKAKEIAEDLAKNLKVTLGDGYKVEQNDEKIEIKGKDKKTFSLVVGGSTVPGVSVKIK